MRRGTIDRKRTWSRTIAAFAVAVATLGASLALASGSLTGPGAHLAPTPSGSAPAASSLTVTLSPSPTASIDLGQSVEFTATPSGGTPPYTNYAWYEGSFSTCSGDRIVANTSVTTFNLTSPTSDLYVCVAVTDSELPPVVVVSAQSVLVQVNPALTVGRVGPAAALAPAGAIDNGRSVTLVALAGNGTAPLKYQWYSGPSPSSCTLTQLAGATAATLMVSPTTTTSYCYAVTDSSVGTPAQSGQSPGATVTVDPTLVAGAPVPSGLYGDSGQSFTLKSAPAGGTTSYTYAWFSGTSPTCSSDVTPLGTAATQVVTPTTTTQYCYSLTDTSYNAPVVSSPTVQVTVNATLTAGPITPAAPSIDSGTPESVTFQSAPSGGALVSPGGYTYQWYAGTYSTCTADSKIAGATFATYPASPASSQYYCYEVTDANGTHAYSPTDPLTVNPPLVGGTAGPVGPVIDAGQSVTLTSSPTGGTPPYVYQWFASNGCSGAGLIPTATASTYVATAAGTYTYRVTDSSVGALAIGQRSECASAGTTVTVNSDPVPSAPVASPSATIDLGQSVTLTGSVVGGTGTPVITYQWRTGTTASCAAAANIAGATGTTYTVAPTSNTYYCYSVTDGSVNPPTELSSSVLITVNGLPTVGAITSSGPPYLDPGTGETVTLYAHASGGTGTLTYQWYNGSFASCASDTNPIGTNSPVYTTPLGMLQSSDYCYKVTDSASPAKSAETATAFVVTIDGALTAGTPTANLSALDLGQAVTLTATASGGYATASLPYTFQWFIGNATCALSTLSMIAPATSSPFSLTPGVAGTFDFCYRVTDNSNGTPVQQSVYSHVPVAVTVHGALTAGALTCYDNTGHLACASQVPNGDSVTLTAHPSGGNPAGYAYVWRSGGSSVCLSDGVMAGQINATVTVTAAFVPGAYYCYTVSDGTHPSAVTSPTLFVDPAPGGPPALPLLQELWVAGPGRLS